MGTPRAYNILRAYVNREWDRISSVDLSGNDVSAQKELEDSLNNPTPRPIKKTILETPEEAANRARRILGVEAGADFATIRAAFENLHQRSDPGRFPEGSAERSQAASIRTKIDWAFEKLSEGVNSTEKRFRSLEID